MKFTLNWLKDYLDTSANAGDISTALTDIGLEVEGMEDMSAKLADFITARIESTEKHPDADKLQICQVNDGQSTRQVVCGAPNARAGIDVVLATEGVCIPTNGMKIKKSSIRGVESNGMLCSADELGVGSDSAGIIELSGTPKPGSSAAAALGLDDVTFDVALTPNRGDCFSVYGIARDLAAKGMGMLKGATIPQSPPHSTGTSPCAVTIATKTPLCPEFVGISIKGVRNGESPDWLKQRLNAIGQKPISALVDVTNYIMLTFGRPLHAYDVRHLEGTVTAREAVAGENFTALNGESYTLDAGMLVIADDKKILGLAGIMGSEGSGCQLDTTDVFIESALFDAVNIAQTGQKLGLISDARMRFERGVDTGFVTHGAELAASMIVDICGGEASGLTSSGSPQATIKPIDFDCKSVNQLTSLSVDDHTCQSILETLGFNVDNHAKIWKVTPPTWRHDISCAADLVEEIARITGYENIAPTSLPQATHSQAPADGSIPQHMRSARQILTAQNLVEVKNWTFVSEAQAMQTGEVNPALRLANPISSELSIMRSSLLPHLLGCAQRNLNKGSSDIRIFEAGQVFTGILPDQQTMAIAALFAGRKTMLSHGKQQFSATSENYTVYDAKAAAYSLLAAFGVNTDQLSITRDAPEFFHPGRSMRLSLGGKITLAHVGELHPSLTKDYDLDRPAAYCEILLENIPTPKAKSTAKKPLSLSPYPAVDRDFAFTIAAEVEVENLRRAALRADKHLIKSAEIFDVYQGERMETGKKSVALRVTLEPHEKTLTDEEINVISEQVIAQVGKATGATLRQ